MALIETQEFPRSASLWFFVDRLRADEYHRVRHTQKRSARFYFSFSLISHRDCPWVRDVHSHAPASVRSWLLLMVVQEWQQIVLPLPMWRKEKTYSQ